MRFFLVLALVLAILVTTFAVQNFKTVDVNFLTWKLSGSLALVLLITLSVGILIGILVSAPSSLRKRMEMRGVKKNLRQTEKNLVQAQTAATPSPAQMPDPERKIDPGVDSETS